MTGRWRSRDVLVPMPMDVVRRLWGRACRVDTHTCERLGTRHTTVLLCDDAGPVGWLAVRCARDCRGAGGGTVHRVGWDAVAGRSEADVWRLADELAATPVPIGAACRWDAGRHAA